MLLVCHSSTHLLIDCHLHLGTQQVLGAYLFQTLTSRLGNQNIFSADVELLL